MDQAARDLVNQRWPTQHPDRIQLYSLATPNGQKVGVALEEMELPYEAHLVDIGQGDQHTDAFMAINPNSKIPAIIDPDGPDGRPLAVLESGAILLHLAEKSGKLLPANPRGRSEAIQWLMLQMGGVGPMFGQFGHFHKFARETCKDPYPLERYRAESRRLLGVLNTRLAGNDYLAGGEFSIADVATFPWVKVLSGFYEAADLLGVDEFENITAWVDRCLARPAVQRGMDVCKRP